MPRIADTVANGEVQYIRTALILSIASTIDEDDGPVTLYSHKCFLCGFTWNQRGKKHAKLDTSLTKSHMLNKHNITSREDADKARAEKMRDFESKLAEGGPCGSPSAISGATGGSIPRLFASAIQNAWQVGGAKYKEYLDALVDVAAADVMSFRAIENPAFVRLVGILRPELKGWAVKRATLCKALDERDAVIRARMQAVFAEAAGLSISFDGTDFHGYKVLAVMAHYTLRESSEVEKFPIALISPKDEVHFDADMAMDTINDALRECGISGIDGCVNDGASDARKTARGLFTKIEDDAGRFSLLNIPCIPHYLNLVAEAGIAAINRHCNSGRNQTASLNRNGLFGGKSSAGAVDGLLSHFLGINRSSRVHLNNIIDQHEDLWPKKEKHGTESVRRPVKLTTWDCTRWWSFLAVLRALRENLPFIRIYMERYKDEWKRTAPANAGQPELVGYWIAVWSLKDELAGLEELLLQIRAPSLKLQAAKTPSLPEFPRAIIEIYSALSATSKQRGASRCLGGVFAQAALDKLMAEGDTSHWGGSTKTIIESALERGKAPLPKPGKLEAHGRSKQAIFNWINTSFCYAAAVASALHPSPRQRQIGFFLLGVEHGASDAQRAIALAEAVSTMRAFMRMDGEEDAIGPGEPPRKKARVSKGDEAPKPAVSGDTLFALLGPVNDASNETTADKRPVPGSRLREEADSFLADMRKRKEYNADTPEGPGFLVYWNASGTPALAGLALKLAAVLVSQADAERLFSILSFMWPPSRSRLDIKRVEKLLRVRFFSDAGVPGDVGSLDTEQGHLADDEETREAWRVIASLNE